MSSGKKQPAVNFPTPAQLKERADNAKKCGTTYLRLCYKDLHNLQIHLQRFGSYGKRNRTQPYLPLLIA